MKKKFILLVTIGLFSVTLGGCASFTRSLKNAQSEWSGGLNRIIKVYSATGELIETYEGKFDINYEDDRLLFDDANTGERHCIYYSTGIVTVDEK